VQKFTVTLLPLPSDRWVKVDGLPAMTLNEALSKIGSTMYADPVDLWQNLQWQYATRTG
jgi:hypothetical protein